MARSVSETALLARLQKILLDRYASLINEKEQKTVGEIKSLITKSDLTIQSLAQSFAPQDPAAEKNYPDAARKAFLFVRDEIADLHKDVGISYWLTAHDIAKQKVADDEDKSIFLCSILYCLGDDNAAVVIAELQSGLPHAFVVTTINGNFFILDSCQKHEFESFSGTKESVLAKYSYNGSAIKKFLYRFNNSNYEQFDEKS